MNVFNVSPEHFTSHYFFLHLCFSKTSSLFCNLPTQSNDSSSLPKTGNQNPILHPPKMAEGEVEMLIEGQRRILILSRRKVQIFINILYEDACHVVKNLNLDLDLVLENKNGQVGFCWLLCLSAQMSLCLWSLTDLT